MHVYDCICILYIYYIYMICICICTHTIVYNIYIYIIVYTIITYIYIYTHLYTCIRSTGIYDHICIIYTWNIHHTHTQLYYLFQVIQWNMDCLWKTSMNRGIQWAKGSIFVYFRCGSYASILDFHGINLCITPAVGHSANWLLQESQRAILTYLQFVGVHGHYLVVFDMQRNM